MMNIKNFQEKMTEWYKNKGRDLPWRHTKDPYSIWVSEIMLQQTQVDTVIPYYLRFLKALPNIQSLADCDPDTLLKLWEGLGYYRRVRHMQEAAIDIQQRFQGYFPKTYEDIRSLKGIGAYTASAISSIAFDQENGVIDGNTLRILSRLYNRQDNIAQEKTKKLYQKLMDTLISGSEPSVFNQGMMDLGAMICTPKNPKCSECPVQMFCCASKHNTQSILPVNIKNRSKTDIYYITAILRWKDKYILIKNSDGLLQNLYSFIQYEVESPMTFEETFFDEYQTQIRLYDYIKEIKHVFSHRIWHMNVYMGELLEAPNFPEEMKYGLYTNEEIEQLPISTAHRKVLNLR